MLLQILRALQGLEASTIALAVITPVLLMSLGLALIVYNGDAASTRRKLRHLRDISVRKSNMADQFDRKYAAPEATKTTGPVRIKSIYLHPIKSCGFVEVSRALLTKTGFLYDRCFALATEAADPDTGTVLWKFISQRTKPQMCHIQTEIWVPREDADRSDPLVQAGGCVVVTFPDPDPSSWVQRLEAFWDPSAAPKVSCVVPLQPTPALADEYDINLRTFGIHARDASGLDMGKIPAVAAVLPKLKRFLAIPENRGLTLTRCTPETLVRTDKNLAPLEHIGSPAVHGYTDQQPVNINSLSSVHAVSALLPAENRPLNALRFRANLWITGAPAFAEESWKRCRILPGRPPSGAFKPEPEPEPRAAVSPKLSVVCRTSRCTMPNVNLETATFDSDAPSAEKKKGKPQPSTTLIEHRTPETGNPKALGYIGMHCVPEDADLNEAESQGKGLYVQVGDEIEVLETGSHLYGATGNDY
ncbi:Putative molybdenum cofactor sulfurase [Colletotrichum destructivum]|uniref:Molybdenum cofactor sulfurase n=1 Tax=Colletotrichum destructivum TaxID=34406 RepID=A0AAX4J2D4_9PEZI|nr:Putative molybdenum cofactor sulfurase [Colletotrichum destructivum]